MIRICPIVRSKVPLLGTFLRSDSWLAPHALVLRWAICKNVALRSYSVNSEQPKHTFDISKLTRNEIQQLRELKRARERKFKDRTVAFYFSSVAVLFLGLAYAAVPLYRAICARTGFGGIPITDRRKFTDDKLIPVDTEKRIRISFTSEVSQILPWKFVPQQREVYVLPGETALAFYKAKNYSDKDIIGMATYSIAPGEAAQYFNKIQCFCFEEQKLAAGEEIDMPVFFFIDPDFASDPAMRNIDDIILHYTFFRAHYGDGTAVSDSKMEPEMNADEKAASLANAAILSPEVIDTRKDNSN
ncbi:BBT_HP_G0170530.mRNA.1.CDS.1 [Saccharomyces cerevisiae]|nr:BBT_HP_G0019510.mRNA.1.CDS.1 [Saccharomyces cerevisiae]CAI4921427.1 BBT_HP_G0024920.mRNA.1.CDS.1 [Saccharomyces cerevisiae]CAI4980994.1 BBT_HP_G0064220.mRNA.1.CDS.1 [Saccharomyces cerevisiae]CAI5203920.1 BBT_HP_G0170530.mRNA.1.CDS.1 [Saccharomyces cerevisiae]CAI6405873.1 BBT_HP_G0019510.mRNA.1.CDS.1 [Saccharomyces cerevisiae]